MSQPKYSPAVQATIDKIDVVIDRHAAVYNVTRKDVMDVMYMVRQTGPQYQSNAFTASVLRAIADVCEDPSTPGLMVEAEVAVQQWQQDVINEMVDNIMSYGSTPILPATGRIDG